MTNINKKKPKKSLRLKSRKNIPEIHIEDTSLANLLLFFYFIENVINRSVSPRTAREIMWQYTGGRQQQNTSG